MNYLILINAEPGSATAHQALAFCEALVARKHQLVELFFFDSGVKNALSSHWQTFLARHQLTATVCVNSVNTYLSNTDFNESSGFQVAGMAQLAAALTVCQRTLTFGSRDAWPPKLSAGATDEVER